MTANNDSAWKEMTVNPRLLDRLNAACTAALGVVLLLVGMLAWQSHQAEGARHGGVDLILAPAETPAAQGDSGTIAGVTPGDSQPAQG